MLDMRKDMISTHHFSSMVEVLRFLERVRFTASRVGQGERKLSKGNVIIGAYCWVGANVFITEGVKIGENSIIGANSIVTKNVPPHCIVAGNPAKVIKFKSYLPESEKLRLMQKYWDSLSDRLKTNYEGLS